MAGPFLYNHGAVWTLLNAATATGVGDVFELLPAGIGEHSRTAITWQATVTGSPTAVTAKLEGSIDGTTWFTLTTIDSTDVSWVTDLGEMQHLVSKLVKFIRPNLTALTGGTAPTVTIKAVVGA